MKAVYELEPVAPPFGCTCAEPAAPLRQTEGRWQHRVIRILLDPQGLQLAIGARIRIDRQSAAQYVQVIQALPASIVLNPPSRMKSVPW